MIKDELQKIIEEALNSLDIKEVGDIHLEHPVDLNLGDYSTNIAMVLAKNIGENPRSLAKKIVKEINLGVQPLSKVEVAGPGFINFFLSEEVLVSEIEKVLERGNNYGKNDLLKNKKVMVEYTDPNPFKEFHIGHLMTNSIGESIARIIEFGGAEVVRANYQGDVGLHVAKAVWGLQKNNVDLETIDIVLLGKAYVDGAKAYEENEDNKGEIQEINKKIYDKSDDEINKIYDKGRRVSLEYFENIYKKLGTKFEEYFFESETAPVGLEIVKEFLNKVFEESDGAVVFKGEKYGLHTRVFVNKEGLPTYEAKELGLAKMKFEKHNPDLSISITANEVNEYFKVLLKAIELINNNWSKRIKHLSHGMLRLPSGKMSSRTGDVVTALSLIQEVIENVLPKMKSDDSSSATSSAEATAVKKAMADKKELAEKIAIGAIKYSILKSAMGKDVIFDFEKSLSFEGNSGPYLQYAYVRANSVLEKAKIEGINLDTGRPSKFGRPTSKLEVERLIYRFPEVVEISLKEYSPHHIATYLFELAQTFSVYYTNNKIVDGEDKNSPYKVALTKSVAQILKNGLYLLGIKVPERM